MKAPVAHTGPRRRHLAPGLSFTGPGGHDCWASTSGHGRKAAAWSCCASRRRRLRVMILGW